MRDEYEPAFSAGPIDLVAAFDAANEHWSPRSWLRSTTNMWKSPKSVANLSGTAMMVRTNRSTSFAAIYELNMRAGRPSICMKAQCMWCLAAFDISRSRTKNAESF